MEIQDYIRNEIDGLDRGFNRTTSSLTQAELAWRPASGCNSMGLIIFHMTKFEDSFIQNRMQNKPEIWTSGKWAQKLNMKEDEAGAHYTVDQVNAFPVPDIKGLLEYCAAVRANTKSYLNSLTAADMDRKVTLPRFGEMSIAGMFSLMVSHISQHIGEISYIRGIQRGMDK